MALNLPRPDFLRNADLRRFLPIILAVVSGLIAIVGVQHYVASQLAQQRAELEKERQKLLAQYPAPIQVVVAARDLPSGTVIEPAALKLGELPERFSQPYGVRGIGEAVGMVTVAPIAAGEQVMLTKLRKPEDVPSGSTLSTIVPKGKRAVTIQVDTITGVGGFVRPGDIVDVLWTISIPGPGGTNPQLVTMTLFQDVPVMAVERDLPGRAAHRNEGEGEGAEGQPAGGVREYTVTLALAPQEISFLLFAREQGRIQLSLRPKNESGTQQALTPVNMNTVLSTLLGSGLVQPQQAVPKPTRQVELYKGLSRDVVILEEPTPEEPSQPATAPPAPEGQAGPP